MSIHIVQRDITTMKVDGIVNAANSRLIRGGGVCGAIFQQAGEDALGKACEPLAPISTGEAVVTSGFNLPASVIVHVVGPIYDPEKKEECERLLRLGIKNALKAGGKAGCRSMAFPLLSTGIYGYPPEQGIPIILEELAQGPDHGIEEIWIAETEKRKFALLKGVVEKRFLR